jgi:hypothetical protein
MKTDHLKIISPKELEDYQDRADDIAGSAWPEFMLHDPIANENWHELFDRFEEYQFAMWDEKAQRMAAMGNSVPFSWDKSLEELPEGGWDWVFLKAIEDHKNSVRPNGASHGHDWKIERLSKSCRASAAEREEQIPFDQYR